MSKNEGKGERMYVKKRGERIEEGSQRSWKQMTVQRGKEWQREGEGGWKVKEGGNGGQWKEGKWKDMREVGSSREGRRMERKKKRVKVKAGR